MAQDLGKSSTSLDPNVAALLSYLGGFVTGIVFFAIEKENKFVRFHALQSVITFAAIFILQAVLVSMFSAYMLVNLLNLASLALWVLLMIKAYQGEKFKLPVIGDIAEKKI